MELSSKIYPSSKNYPIKNNRTSTNTRSSTNIERIIQEISTKITDTKININVNTINNIKTIILCINNNTSTNICIDILHIIEITSNNGNTKKIYDWKNNFSIEFLNKIFSLSSELAYSVLYFYHLLLEYNKKVHNKYNEELYLHEYIYFITNSNIGTPNFINNIKNIRNIRNIRNNTDKDTKILSIFQSIIDKNIFSTDFLKKNKSDFYNFCYSYDYFIQYWLVAQDTLNENNKSKINIKKLESEVYKDIDRTPYKYFISGEHFKNKDTSTFFKKIKDLRDKFIEDNKNIGQLADNIYIKILQSLYQNLWSFSTIFFSKLFNNNYYNSNIYTGEINQDDIKYIGKEKFNNLKEQIYYKLIYLNNNIIIESSNVSRVYFVENRNKKENGLKENGLKENVFLYIIVNVKIDILNNKICFNHSFEWINENIRKKFLEQLIDVKLKYKRLSLNWGQSNNKYNNETKIFSIINFDEENKEYNYNSCFKYLKHIEENHPLFILVSTQNSTTKFKNGQSVSFQHIMKENLKKIWYSYTIKGKNIKDYDYGLKKISGNPVDRLRLYKRNNISNEYINNVGIDILQKKFLSNGTLCIKLKFKDNGIKKRYIFLNTNLLDTKLSRETNLQGNSKDLKTFEYIFNLLTEDNNFFQGNNKKSQNLIDLFTEGYDIYFLGNIDLNFLQNINGNVIKSLKNKNKNNKYDHENSHYNNLIYCISEYFSEKKNSIMNKKNLKIKKPSIIGSKKNKNDYLKEFTQFKKEYEEKIFNFFIHTTLVANSKNNIFYTSLNKKSNNETLNIL
jgi:hypothetical protein